MGRGHAAPAIPMNEREFEVVKRYNQKRSIAHHYKLRTSIILRASEGESNLQISQELALSYNTVKAWRRRWQQHYQELCVYQTGVCGQGISDHELMEKVLEILTDIPRSGAPKRITLTQENQIVALACKRPEDFGIPMTQWNREMLAKVAVAADIVDTIARRPGSPRYVSELLKKKRIKAT